MLKKSLNTILATGLVASSALWAPQASAADPFIGEIMMVGFNFAPRGWATCDGQLLSIASNTALFSLMGTTFGGDGRTTFGLPDLRGRSAVHVGTGPGIPTVTWGERWGAETVALTVSNLPAHTHSISATGDVSGITASLRAHNSRGNNASPVGNAIASKSRTNIYSTTAPSVAMHPDSVQLSGTVSVTGTTGSTGSNTPVSVRDPSLGIYHVIALTGTFPSRS